MVFGGIIGHMEYDDIEMDDLNPICLVAKQRANLDGGLLCAGCHISRLGGVPTVRDGLIESCISVEDKEAQAINRF